MTFDIRIEPILFAEGMDVTALDLDPVERDVLLGLLDESEHEPAQH